MFRVCWKVCKIFHSLQISTYAFNCHRWLPYIVISTQTEELVTFCITFLRNSTYIRNPHLKSKLVEILFYGIQPNRVKPNGMLGDSIMGNQFALQNLMHALMNFYIGVLRPCRFVNAANANPRN